MNIELNNQKGIILKTAGKYCEEDIAVAPVLQTKELTVTQNGTQLIGPDDGNCGINKITITTNVPTITNVSTVQEMNSLLVESNVGQYYKYTGTSDFTEYYINGDIYTVEK